MSLTEVKKANVSSRAFLGLVGKKAPDYSDFSLALGPENVHTEAFDRVKASVDASHYMYMPKAILTPKDRQQVAQVFKLASNAGMHITFRSGGTSLSGQGVTDGILVDTRKGFQRIEIIDDGAQVRVQPGATVRQVNARLHKFGRKLGPDPASEIACTIGGVVANNSSGMACGTKENTYQTIASAVIVLPSGTTLDTAHPDAEAILATNEPELCAKLIAYRDAIGARPDLVLEINRQYQIKNTMGYSLNSLVDHHSPVDILLHLMVGSEGTLGFVAEAVFNTVPLHKNVATTFLIFETLKEATDSLTELIATDPATIELLDSASLKVVKPSAVKKQLFDDFEAVSHAGLLVEYQSESPEALETKMETATNLLASLPLVNTPTLSKESSVRNALWYLRKGLYAAVAGERPSGTTALLEDISVPVAKLSQTCQSLQLLFERHGYLDAVIFGHAKDGNIHFLLNEDFTDPSKSARYEAFTEDMVDLVLSAGGSLKAEHGTGRIMAPYVKRQFGAELYAVMQGIKLAFDPKGMLNPGVLISGDPQAHLRNIKATPTVEESVDNCVECGYCEPVCPSKGLTTTPRQRIAIRRAIAAAQQLGDRRLVAQLSKSESYNSVDTCAVDGMCATACPLSINTGSLVRELRASRANPVVAQLWKATAKNWEFITGFAAMALSTAAKVPSWLLHGPNVLARKVLAEDLIPLWSSDLPRGGTARTKNQQETVLPDLVYFEACVGAMFGSQGQGVALAFDSLIKKAGLTAVRPNEIEGLCCGTPWKSKGMVAGYDVVSRKTLDAVWQASNSGQLPIVCDNSSCTEGLVEMLKSKAASIDPKFAKLVFIDAVDYVSNNVIGNLEFHSDVQTLAVHPTCSSTRLGSNDNLLGLASLVATDVAVPDGWGCCGFAGDRGMLHPELTASATSAESKAVSELKADAHVSCNKTCEIGMSRSTGQQYVHVLELIDQHSTTKLGA